MRNLTSIVAALFLLNFTSCKEDVVINIVTPDQKLAIEDQSLTEAYFNEAGDLSTMAFNTPSADQIKGGRTNGSITFTVSGDTRFNGAVVTLVTSPNNNPLDPNGTITIDFGNGQTDPRGVVRKGMIIVTYQGLRFSPGSTTITTFDNYEVNGVKIEGTRTVTTNSFTLAPTLSIVFAVADVGGKATFSDQTTITRNATHTHTITFGTTIGGTTWKVEGLASGKTRTGVNYSSLIERALIFRTECAFSGYPLPAEGLILFTLNAIPIVLNYGDDGASCDNVVNVLINNQSQNVTVGN